MNRRTNKSEKKASGGCLCQGAGPVLTEFIRQIGPPDEARRHFETARLEFLKGLRALLDSRIERCSMRAAGKPKGAKIDVE
jgi:hypothetical protein